MAYFASTPVQLGTAASNLRTVAANMVLFFTRIIFCNTSDDSVTISVWYVATGTTTNAKQIIKELTILPKRTFVWNDNPMLPAGATIRALASTGTSVSAHCSGEEKPV